MKTIILGFLIIAVIVFVFYITGKIASKYLTAHDDKDYIGHGFAIWVVFLFFSGVFYAIGKIILHLI